MEDDTIYFTGPHGVDIPGKVIFQIDPETDKPEAAVLQVRDDDGEWHTVADLDEARMWAYWADFEAWANDPDAVELAWHRRAA